MSGLLTKALTRDGARILWNDSGETRCQGGNTERVWLPLARVNRCVRVHLSLVALAQLGRQLG